MIEATTGEDAIASTASHRPDLIPMDIQARALAAGADGYVSKPFSPRALLATVRKRLGEV